MKKRIVSCLAVLALVPASLALACTEDGKEGIFPENSHYIPANSFGFQVSEAQFNASIEKAEKLYAPVFAARGRKLKIVNKWKDGTVNAYAKQNGNVSEVHMFGGLARHPKITSDGFELVICHETGHHIGGAPKKRGLLSGSWASNEGQSDYFATLKCSRELWKNEDNAAIVAAMEIPATVTERCQKAFDDSNEIALCKRATMAGKALGDTLADMNKLPETNIDTPDSSIVSRTDHNHPKAQCRTDTYFAGAVCPKASSEAVSDTNVAVGTCTQEKGEVLGIRPLCWYKPVGPDGEVPTSVWPKSRVATRQ